MGDTGYRSAPTLLATTTSEHLGIFGIPPFTCPAGNPETYILALGGNAGSGTNSAIGLMAVLGPCNSLRSSTTVIVNELTTVAAQWALAQFIDPTGRNIGTSSTNTKGLANAVTQIIRDLVNPATGGPASFLPVAVDCFGSSPSANCNGLMRLDTLANILAACVESPGSASPSCTTLFSKTSSTDTTLQAAHAIAVNPTANVAALFALRPEAPAPFSPALTSAPTNFVLGLNFAPSAADFDGPNSPALDAAGNLFATNLGILGSHHSSVSELTVASGYATGLNFAPPGAVLDTASALALDAASNVFAANQVGNSVSELTAASHYATGLNFTPSGAAFDSPNSLALDAADNILAANYFGNSVSELTIASHYATGLNFDASGAAFDGPNSLALDAAGNIFVANYSGNSVSELTAASHYATGLNFHPSGAAFDDPNSLALDAAGNIFVANYSGNSVSELTAASGYAKGLNFAAHGAVFNRPYSLAVDAAANIFVVNYSGGSVSELTAASHYATGLNFAPPGAAFDYPLSLALDAAGNVFVANLAGGSVSELIGLATPVLTPVQACLQSGKNVCLP